MVETVQGLAKQFGDFAHDVQSAYGSLNSFGADTTALADSALRQAQDGDADLQRAQTNATNAATDLKTAQQNHAANPNPQAVTDAQTAHDTAQTTLKNAQAHMDALKAQAHQASEDLDHAAQQCAKALGHAQSDGIHNKHWWEHVGEFMSEWGGKIADIANDLAPFLDVLALATS